MKLPKNWGEVSLKQYQEIAELAAVDMDEIDKQVKVLSILSGRTEDDILDIDLPTLLQLVKSVSFIYQIPAQGKVVPKVRIKGNRYRVNLEVNKLTGGEYIEMAEYLKAPTENLHHILAIYLKPIDLWGQFKKDRFTRNKEGVLVQTINSKNRTAKLVRENLTMDFVFALSSFFLSSSTALTAATKDYLIATQEAKLKKVRKDLKKVREDLLNTGVGS